MNMSKGSMIEIAIKMLTESDGPLSFQTLWEGVKAALDIPPEEEGRRIGHFYTDLSLSGVTTVLKDNYWDLAERQPMSNKVDMTDVYSDVNQTSGDADDAKDDEEYDLAIMGDLHAGDVDLDGDEEGGEVSHGEDGVDYLSGR